MHDYEQVMLPLSALTVADYNPRAISKAQLAQLKRSLEEFGFVQPVVARRSDMLIIGGHQRLEAYRQLLGPKAATTKVPVVLVDVDDERAKALNLALNKISGEWDYDKLAGLLDSMSETSLELSGFSSREVDDIVELVGGASMLPEDDGNFQDGIDLAARRFSFTVETKEEAELVQRTLRAYGMVKLKQGASAFVAAMRAAEGIKS